MLFSVLIPVYNVEKYLEECVDSILNQTFRDFEIVLIDDGSKDNSGNICDDYSDRYQDKIKVYHKENQGLLMARRDGIRLAQGEYLLSVDSDDFLAPNTLERFAEIIDMYHPDLIQYDLFLYRSADDILNVNFGPLPIEIGKVHDIGILREWLIDRKYIIWSMAGKCAKRTCFEPDKDYSKYKHVKYGEDTLQSCEVYDNASNFVYLDECFYYYRASSGMTSSLPLKCIDDFFELRDELYSYATKWQIGEEKDKIAYYIFYEAYFYLINMIDNHCPRKEGREKLVYISNQEKFIEAYNQLVPGDYYRANARWKMKFLLGLLKRKQYFLMHVAMKIKGYMK